MDPHKYAQPPQTGILLPAKTIGKCFLVCTSRKAIEADQGKEKDLDVEETRHHCRTVAAGDGRSGCTGVANTVAINAAADPTFTDLQTGTLNAIPALLIHWRDNRYSYQLAGLGNGNVRAKLSTSSSATVHCRNKGGKIAPEKASAQRVPATTGQREVKNGNLTFTLRTTERSVASPVPGGGDLPEQELGSDHRHRLHERPDPGLPERTTGVYVEGLHQRVVRSR